MTRHRFWCGKINTKHKSSGRPLTYTPTRITWTKKRKLSHAWAPVLSETKILGFNKTQMKEEGPLGKQLMNKQGIKRKVRPLGLRVD